MATSRILKHQRLRIFIHMEKRGREQGRKEYEHYLSSMANTNPKLIRRNWDECFWHGHNVVTLLLHRSRAPLPGSEVQEQSHTAFILPKVICKITQQESGRPEVRFGCTPISWLIYRLEENYMKQIVCWGTGRERRAHMTPPLVLQGVKETGLCMQEGWWKESDNETLNHILVPQFSGSQLNGALFYQGLWFSLEISHWNPINKTTTINN